MVCAKISSMVTDRLPKSSIKSGTFFFCCLQWPLLDTEGMSSSSIPLIIIDDSSDDEDYGRSLTRRKELGRQSEQGEIGSTFGTCSDNDAAAPPPTTTTASLK